MTHQHELPHVGPHQRVDEIWSLGQRAAELVTVPGRGHISRSTVHPDGGNGVWQGSQRQAICGDAGCVSAAARVHHGDLTSSHLAAREGGLRIKGVDFIWTVAADVDRTARFYRDVLGLPETGIQADDWREFQAGSATLAVTPAHVGLQPPRVLLALAVDDVDAALEEVRALGVEVLHETRDTPACRNAMIADPEGNPIWLHQRHDGTFG